MLRIASSWPILASISLALSPGFLPGQVTILKGMSPVTAATVKPHLHSLVTAPDTSLWTVLNVNDGTSGTSDTILTRSTDAGKTWSGSWPYPTLSQHNRGSIAMGIECSLLHAVWTENNATGRMDLMYQTFDTSTRKWIGTPQIVQAGGSTLKWFPHDLVVTRKGTVVLGVSTGASGGPGITGQATVIILKKRGDTSFRAPIQVNKPATAAVSVGRAPSLHAEGDLLHILYRTKWTSGANYGVSYRGYDLAKDQFVQASDVPIGPNNNTGMSASLNKATALDAAGNLYCLYVSAGVLRMAYAAAGSAGSNAGWSDITIYKDASLLGNNQPTVAYTQFSISTGDQGEVYTYYSKLSESRKSLYLQGFKNGQPRLPAPLPNEQLVKSTTENDSFLKVTGYKNSAKISPPFFITSGTPTSAANGIVQFWNTSSSGARAVEYGVACQGSLAQAPRMYALTRPVLATNFDLQLAKHPASALFLLGFALNCGKGLDLKVMNAPGCFLYLTPLVDLGIFQVDATGRFKISAPLPNTPQLVGTAVFLQDLVAARGANGAGLLAGNVLGVFF